MSAELLQTATSELSQEIKALEENGISLEVAKKYCEARSLFRSYLNQARLFSGQAATQLLPAYQKQLSSNHNIISQIEFDFPEIRKMYEDVIQVDSAEAEHLPPLNRLTFITVPPHMSFSIPPDLRELGVTYSWFRYRETLDDSGIVRVNIPENSSVTDIMAAIKEHNKL